ncbi:hypothetical protein HDE_04518 [Halotydeus destructor]|nr:hypothetical protein HDE_04518 [Halotydeus destructor]
MKQFCLVVLLVAAAHAQLSALPQRLISDNLANARNTIQTNLGSARNLVEKNLRNAASFNFGGLVNDNLQEARQLIQDNLVHANNFAQDNIRDVQGGIASLTGSLPTFRRSA